MLSVDIYFNTYYKHQRNKRVYVLYVDRQESHSKTSTPAVQTPPNNQAWVFITILPSKRYMRKKIRVNVHWIILYIIVCSLTASTERLQQLSRTVNGLISESSAYIGNDNSVTPNNGDVSDLEVRITNLYIRWFKTTNVGCFRKLNLM